MTVTVHIRIRKETKRLVDGIKLKNGATSYDDVINNIIVGNNKKINTAQRKSIRRVMDSVYR